MLFGWLARGARTLHAAVAALSAVHCGPAPRAPGEEAPAWEKAWKEDTAPDCFAYSATRRAYVCVGMSLDLKHDGDSTKWTGSGFVDVIAADGAVESHRVWANVGLPVAPRAAMKSRLASVGPTVGPATRVPMKPGVPVELGNLHVRYEADIHEGDASFEWLGDLTVRCADGTEKQLGVRKRDLELGETAFLFHAGGDAPFAFSVLGVDGGEGSESRWLNTVVVDAAALCAGRTNAVAGPVEGRSIGP
jgi:hypothetical protein